MTKEQLLEKANDLPLAPGVYLMMDASGKVIYVGKAKKLKNRVSQYFQLGTGHNEKTRRMVSQVDHFDTIFVSSEFEALILENSLIKQHQPHYNILLKDDKGYPFVRLSHGPYPRFTLANKTADDGARYFGPFGARGETRAAIDAVCAAFRLPTCTRRFPRDIGKERPCLNHHMGRCDGFCRGEPDAEEYQRRIEQACSLLSGHYKTLARELKTEMEHEAEQLHFEQAAVLRDRIAAIEVLGKRQKVIAGVCADTDVWGLYTGAAKSGCAVVHVEDGSVEAKASRGEDVLNAAIAVDDGARYFGEVALVPYDSPIRSSGLLFYNTLYDENASCHLAFGEAYPECIAGGERMTREELDAHGLNHSLTHVDFMVGTADLSITGTTHDGRELPVFRSGNFAL